MRKIVALLLISLLIPTSSFSQTIYPKIVSDSTVLITTDQLKEIDLIFNEHDYLLNENDLLNQKISTLEKINKNLVQIDSLKTENIVQFQSMNKKLNKSNKRKNYVITGLSGGLLVTLLLLIL